MKNFWLAHKIGCLVLYNKPVLLVTLSCLYLICFFQYKCSHKAPRNFIDSTFLIALPLISNFCFISLTESVCNFQSMKSPVEMNSLLSKFFCYIALLLYQLIRRDTGRLANEAFTSNPIVSSKQ